MLLKLKQEESDIFQSCLDVISIKRKDLEQIDIKLKLLLDSYLDQIIDKESFQEKKFELMSKKKTLEEQILSLKKNQGNWIEPMRNWINEAQTVQQVAESADLQLKKVLAKKIFGSNLFLENKTVRGDGQKSWSSLRSTPTGRTWVGLDGVGPSSKFYKNFILTVERQAQLLDYIKFIRINTIIISYCSYCHKYIFFYYCVVNE